MFVRLWKTWKEKGGTLDDGTKRHRPRERYVQSEELNEQIPNMIVNKVNERQKDERGTARKVNINKLKVDPKDS